MRLTRDSVLQGALELVERVGVDALTMRALARHLGVQNGATYWHFGSKRALLDAMAEAVVAGLVDEPPRQEVWTDQLVELAGRLHAALVSRRDAARIVAGSFAPEPHTLAYGETMIGIMRAAGIPDRTAAWAQDAITHLVLGHAVEQQAAAEQPPDTALAALDAAVATGHYPHLGAVRAHIPAPHPPEHLELGLRLLVDGLALRTQA